MKLTLDRDADALYLELDEAAAVESQELAPGVILDFNAAGRVVGVEMLHVSKRVSAPNLARMEFETVGA